MDDEDPVGYLIDDKYYCPRHVDTGLPVSLTPIYGVGDEVCALCGKPLAPKEPVGD